MTPKREAVAIVPLAGELVRDAGIELALVATEVDRALGRIHAAPHSGDYLIVAVERGRTAAAARAIADALNLEVPE